MNKFRKLDSLIGEYLKTLMMKKLNNPNFSIPYIAKSREIKKKFNGERPHIRKPKEFAWKPAELRN